MAIKVIEQARKPAANRVQQAELGVDNYPCRIAQVIELGLHHKDVWDAATNKFQKATDKPPVNMLMVTYEFVTEFMKDEAGNEIEDKPRWLSEDFPLYPLNVELATATKRYLALDKDKKFGGDWAGLAGAPCTVSIAHKKSGKAKIGNVAPPMKGFPVPELKNPVKVFDLSEPDMEVFNSLPEWLREKIKSNLEFEGSPLEAILGGAEQKPKEDKAEPVKAPVELPVEDEDNNPW